MSDLPADILKRLKLEPWHHSRRAPLERYMDEFGEPALREMLEQSERRHRCCWAPIDGPHSVGCSEAEDEDAQQTQAEGLF